MLGCKLGVAVDHHTGFPAAQILELDFATISADGAPSFLYLAAATAIE
jgi:hypothetical protein